MSFSLSTGNTVYASASASIISQTDTTATIRITASAYITNGWVQSTGVVASIYINGSVVSSQTVFGNGTYYAASYGTKSVTYDKVISKTKSAQSVKWDVQFYQFTDGTKQSLKQTNTGSVSIGKKTSYTVTYNANGGSDAPDAQTKWHDEDLTLDSAEPTRTGYIFQGWGTSADDETVDYAAGASYEANAAVTLYAIWKAEEYAVTFDANGGENAPGAVTKTYGIDLILPIATPTRTNYNFLGWATSGGAATAQHQAGGTFTTEAATTLYAVWELAYWSPRIVGLSADRCDSDGTHNDYGTYALVTFDWETCQLLGENDIASCSVSIGDLSESPDVSGTNGSVSLILGGDLSVDAQHSVTVTLLDSLNGSASRGVVILKAQFPMDFKANGMGAAFNKPAELDDTLDVNWNALFRKGVVIGDPDGDHRVLAGNGAAGFISPFGGTVAPKGFLWCDGAEYARADYPELFAVIGTSFGSGDGSTTFNVPNLNGRVPVGVGSGHSLGSTGGEAEHTLTVGEMAHVEGHIYHYGMTETGTGGTNVWKVDGAFSDSYPQSGVYRPISSTSASSSSVGCITLDVGGDQPHNNMQPYTVTSYIISTGRGGGVSVQDVIQGATTLPLGVEYGGTGATSVEGVLSNFGIGERLVSVEKSRTWVFAIRDRGNTETQAGSSAAAGWFNTTCGYKINGTDDWEDYLYTTKSTTYFTLNKPGQYRCKFTAHFALSAAGRLGVGWFQGSTEVASNFIWCGSTAGHSATSELVIDVTEPVSVTPKIFVSGQVATKHVGGHLTNFTIEYLGAL